jgi:hypothetical protein
MGAERTPVLKERAPPGHRLEAQLRLDGREHDGGELARLRLEAQLRLDGAEDLASGEPTTSSPPPRSWRAASAASATRIDGQGGERRGPHHVDTDGAAT